MPEASLFSAIPEAPARATAVSSEEDDESEAEDNAELPDDDDEELAQLRRAAEEEDEDGEKGKEKQDKDEKHTKEKMARTVFVGNVPVTTDRKALKKLFKDYGTVESVRLRSVALAKESLSNYRKAPSVCSKCISVRKRGVLF